MIQQTEPASEIQEYDQPCERREWAHGLSAGIAAALNMFDPPEVIDEALLARVVRNVAIETDDLGHLLFLRALADALDHPKAERKLTLSRGQRGRPGDKKKVERALAIGPFVEGLVGRGWKKEAAIQEAMSQLQLSRAGILRSCAEYKRLQPLTVDPIQMEIDSSFHRNRRKSIKS